jgi:hypothetical protein
MMPRVDHLRGQVSCRKMDCMVVCIRCVQNENPSLEESRSPWSMRVKRLTAEMIVHRDDCTSPLN